LPFKKTYQEFGSDGLKINIYIYSYIFLLLHQKSNRAFYDFQKEINIKIKVSFKLLLAEKLV
jgi:hypothetical protein